MSQYLNLAIQSDFEKMQDALAGIDKDLNQIIDKFGYATTRCRPCNLWELIVIITSQQISKSAANSIQNRLKEKIDDHATAEDILALSIDDLRHCGLSRPKANYVLSLCQDIISNNFDFTQINQLDDNALINYVTQLKGFGQWSGKIFALYCCHRANVFPTGDLALHESIKRIKNLEKRPDEKLAANIAEIWQPYRGAAAFLLWHYYAKNVRDAI